jgi:hypothetical protein
VFNEKFGNDPVRMLLIPDEDGAGAAVNPDAD